VDCRPEKGGGKIINRLLEKRPATVPSALGSIRVDELLPLPVLGQRFGLAKKSLIQAQRQGLRTVKFGHRKYCFGPGRGAEQGFLSLILGFDSPPVQ